MRPDGLASQEEPFPLAAGRGPPTYKPRRHDFRVVDHEQIAGGEQLGQITKGSMRKRAVGPVHDE